MFLIYYSSFFYKIIQVWQVRFSLKKALMKGHCHLAAQATGPFQQGFLYGNRRTMIVQMKANQIL